MKKTIEIEAFVTPEGRPTCALDVQEGKFCIMLRTSRLGMCDSCCLETNSRNYLYRYPSTKTGKAYEGYLIPSEKCIVWEQKC